MNNNKNIKDQQQNKMGIQQLKIILVLFVGVVAIIDEGCCHSCILKITSSGIRVQDQFESHWLQTLCFL